MEYLIRVFFFFFLALADCVHVQLYGDSKDRYKQGQTKASLSLQHFLGVQSGFTLDKESNTIAIVCQDVTVVLAFDTRERLIQWQVKISNNLGEDRSFLVLISSAPAKAKLPSGPAQLHVQEERFCMTLGVPPRLVGTWQIGQLRRYGIVEGKFCFEGGSRCGRGEGLHVLISDQAHEIVRTLQLAAEGKLAARKRSSLACGTAEGQSPRRLFSSSVSFDDQCDVDGLMGSIKTLTGDTSSASYWSSSESRQESLIIPDCDPDYPSSASSKINGMDWQQHSMHSATSAPCLERCASCMSKLGTVSKSSTAAGLQVLGNLAPHLQNRAFDRLSLSSYSGSSGHESDYSVAASPQPPQIKPHRLSPSPLALPPRPPKSSVQSQQQPNSNGVNGGNGGSKPSCKPPMPLPSTVTTPMVSEQVCTCSHQRQAAPSRMKGGAGPYENYDIPKTLWPDHQHTSSGPVQLHHEPQSPQADQMNYDTPRKLKECLGPSAVITSTPNSSPATKVYPNYDTPHVPQAVLHKQCGCPASKLASQATTMTSTTSSMACPCHNVMSWAGFMLPYCRRGAGIEPTGIAVHPVRLSGEGKMPVVNASGHLGVYNNSITSHAGNSPDCPLHSPGSGDGTRVDCANYENLQPIKVIDTQPEPVSKPIIACSNYANLDFSESLGDYENSRELLAKVASQEEDAVVVENHSGADKVEVLSENEDVCQKCGHPKEAGGQDYLIVDEEKQQEGASEASKTTQSVPGYLPMQPAHNACSKDVLSRLCSGIKSSSNPALSVGSSSSSSNLEASRKRSESEYRVPGSAMLSSPYFRRRLLEMSNSEATTPASIGLLALRKRSYSTESAHCLDEDKNSLSPDAPQPIRKCASDNDKEAELTKSEVNGTLSLPAIKIRRSSSVPSKTGHNRDSSSSNDSGVSTGSLSHRTAEFVEFDFSSAAGANGIPQVKKQSVALMYGKSPTPACFHSSLPRKSKSSDPLKELTFQFHRVKLPAKSSSAEADIPTCLPQKNSCKEFSSPGEVPSVPYIDSRSTSSGTSDMSDYIETLSLSSHSSSDAPDNLRNNGRAVATTLRPRSGKEYYKIDRSILVEQGRTVSTSANYANLTPFLRKESQRQQLT
ncbi:hypothetical protein QAD02_016821 [Eretmocerus hayati]|uniref:Uncharacterized protein n=1 Tax=Eretmocerus hayati TaxID=131215 RepID=A0ACC2PEP3_9HYME|nr:hypothetical protein QAD02_016821 [Eretmocerus hayati]